MTDAQITTILSALKIDLGNMISTSYDNRFKQIIQASYKAIVREGVQTLNADDIEDIELIVMYASWLWRKRDTGEGMPRMLRWQLNNRVMSEKATTT